MTPDRPSAPRFARVPSGGPAFVAALLLSAALSPTLAQQPAARPSTFDAADTPGDSGGSITLTWSLSEDDGGGAQNVTGYELRRGTQAAGPFESVGFAAPGATQFRDPSAKAGPYYYQLTAVAPGGLSSEPLTVGPVRASAQWFRTARWNVLIIALFLFAVILYYIERGRRGHPPYVRRIAGLDALEEAIGRATEMGRPIVYVPGVHDMNEVQTVASMTILSHVAKKTAAYETRLMVPNRYSLVMTTARETIRESCLAAGRPDAYREDDIFYISDEQFGFVAGTSGLIVREKPAACLFLGSFFAESLILAEIGNSVGAIQIAGTAQPAQLPFFVAACDYTLIGEELFAASAYLSGEPKQLGSLRGQDIGKMLAFFGILLGTALTTLATLTGSPALASAFAMVSRFFANAS